jgi:hypothetical protein
MPLWVRQAKGMEGLGGGLNLNPHNTYIINLFLIAFPIIKSFE